MSSIHSILEPAMRLFSQISLLSAANFVFGMAIQPDTSSAVPPVSSSAPTALSLTVSL